MDDSCGAILNQIELRFKRSRSSDLPLVVDGESKVVVVGEEEINREIDGKFPVTVQK